MLLTNSLFPGQQENEKIYKILRPHWMILLLKLIIWMVFVLILFLLDWIIKDFFPVLEASPYIDYVNLFKSVYVMFLALGLLILWAMYYLDIQIITNERLVDIDQHSLLHRTVSELHLSRIEDVTAEVKGIFETFLDYGHVYIQTAGATERFTLDNIPNPTGVEKLILDLYEKLPEQQKEHHSSK